MASEIKVDTIVNAGGDNDTGIDLATNDQILLKVANSTKLTMNSTGQTTIVGEGGTTTTNLQQGLCKHWIRHNDGSSIDDSFNNTSLTDNGTGHYTANIANDFGSNQTVSVTGGGSNGTNGDDCYSNCAGSALGTASMKCRQVDETLKDNEHSNIQCWGDLA